LQEGVDFVGYLLHNLWRDGLRLFVCWFIGHLVYLLRRGVNAPAKSGR
jgi:hypothetical protein